MRNMSKGVSRHEINVLTNILDTPVSNSIPVSSFAVNKLINLFSTIYKQVFVFRATKAFLYATGN